MGIAQTIRQLRKQVGYTQEDLARLLDVNRSAIAQWENALSQPRMGNVRKLAEIFGVKVSELLDGDTEGAIPGRSLIRMQPLGRVHAGPFSEEEMADAQLIEVPASVLARHPRAVAVLVEGDCMDRVVPDGMAVVVDPDQEPANGDIVVVEDGDHQALLRRWYRGSSTLMLVADSHTPYDDIVIGPDTPIRLVGTVVWVQSPDELSG